MSSPSDEPSDRLPPTDPRERAGMQTGDLDSDEEVQRIRATLAQRMFGEPGAAPRIGRYPILTRLGEGGMGIVYACWDEQLDRRIAVKVLRTDLRAANVRARIVREARAMAKLNHPNVAHVYEVGEHEGRAFVAMEFVKGMTLRAWLHEHERPWPERLAALLDAGRGLAAAHDEGLVHRDFKPDNVMVSPSGLHGETRVRVMDFGLVRVDDLDDDTRPGFDVRATITTELTERGALLGTPAYMAPEQLRPGEIGPATDQFAFCVSVWEALYGERPYAGVGLLELADNVLHARRREPPSDAGIPQWLRRVIERGLQVDPRARFESMRALLEALGRGEARRRRARRIAAASVVLAAAGALVLGWRLDLARRRSACASAGAEIHEIWDDAARTRLHDALVGTGIGYAASTFDHVAPVLDRQAADWEAGYVATCVAAEVDRTRDEATWRTAADCFASRRAGLASLLEVLTTDTDALAVQRAVTAASALPRPQVCSDDVWLARNQPLDDDPASEDARARLLRAEGLRLTGRYAECLAISRAVLDEQVDGDPRLRKLAAMSAGHCADHTGEYAAATEYLMTAYDLAVTGGDDDGARSAADSLVYTVGVHASDYDGALIWGRVARDLTARLGEQDDIAGANIEGNLAALEQARGNYDEALRLFEHVLAIEERVLGSDDLEVANTLNNLGTLHRVRGDYDGALMLLARALAIKESAYGPEHPAVANSLDNIAIVHWARGEYDRSRPLHERALAIKRAALGDDHPEVASCLNNLGNDFGAAGDLPRARETHAQALAIREKALGPDHPDVATSLNNVGNAERSLGNYAAALPLFERSLAIREKALGPEHALVAASLTNLGNTHAALGDTTTALAELKRSLALREKTLGPDHPLVGETLAAVAEVERTRGELDAAKTDFARALAIDEAKLGADHPDLSDPLIGLARIALVRDDPQAGALAERALKLREGLAAAPRAEAALVLAEAQWAAGERTAARANAERARIDYVAAGDGFVARVREVDAWLAAHPSGA